MDPGRAAGAAREAPLRAAAAALLAVLGGRAHAQARVWHDGVTLFAHMLPLLGEHPYRANVFLLLALAQRERGDLAAEAAALRQAEAIAPESAEVRALLGLLAARTGRFEEAALELGRAVALDPAHPDLRCRLAMVLLQLGRRGEAFVQVQAAFALDQQAACLGRPWRGCRPSGAREAPRRTLSGRAARC